LPQGWGQEAMANSHLDSQARGGEVGLEIDKCIKLVAL